MPIKNWTQYKEQALPKEIVGKVSKVVCVEKKFLQAPCVSNNAKEIILSPFIVINVITNPAVLICSHFWDRNLFGY